MNVARDNARQVREEISSEMWEQLNALVPPPAETRAESGWSARPHYISRLVVDGVHLFDGVTDETMGHGEGWQFLQLGRFLERAGATAALVDLHFSGGRGAAGEPRRMGRACCVRARRSKRTAAAIRPTCVQSGSRSSCC